MQRRPVDLLRAIFDRVLREEPNDDVLLTVGKLVEALECHSRTALQKEAKAVLAHGDTPPLLRFSHDFWLILQLVLSFTGDRKIFDGFFARYANSIFVLDKMKSIKSAWTNLADKVADLADDDALDPKLAAENIRDWTVGARLIGQMIPAEANKQLLEPMTRTYLGMAQTILFNLQAMLDFAQRELANAALPNQLWLFIDLVRAMADLPDITVPETRTGAPKHEDRFIDSFPIFERRSYQARQYDLRRKNRLDPRNTSFHLALKRRVQQAVFLLDLYGQPSAPPPKTGANPTLRQKTIQGIKKPVSIVDHDDFVRFLTAIFLEAFSQLKSSPTDAIQAGWEAVIAMIEDRLDRFTTHSGYDLSDTGPNYLTTKFPRAIAGEELHDCGVYALLIAYWLLNLQQALRASRIDLRLTLHYVILPVHVGLIVRFDPVSLPADADGLPSGGVLVTHNSRLHRFHAKGLREALTGWTATPPEDVDPTDKAKRIHKFLEDFATSLFLGGVDTPVVSRPILARGRPTQRTLWQSYFNLMNKDKDAALFTRAVNSKSGDVAQFYLKYLEILMARSQFFNDVLIKDFWRKSARNLYDTLFEDPPGWGHPLRTFQLEGYTKLLPPLLDHFSKSVGDYIFKETDTRNAITEFLAKNRKKIIAPKARRVFSERGVSFANRDLQKPLLEVSDHLHLCEQFLIDVKKQPRKPWPLPPPYILADMREQIVAP